MSTLEDILMEAELLGIREKVLKKSTLVSIRPENAHKSIKEIYNISMEEVKKEEAKKEDVRIWESALIRSTKYYYVDHLLEVEFNNGRRYLYEEFEDDLYSQFLDAESKGQFFVSKIRQAYKDNGKVKEL
jgi:hypothetical protein